MVAQGASEANTGSTVSTPTSMARRNKSPMPLDRRQTLDYSSGQALMKQGAEVLHDQISAKLETAIGHALPQMEVRFKNLSITAEVLVSNEKSEEILPTLTNDVLKAFSVFSRKKHKETKHILKNVNGVFKPGTMTLVLGQPGSGKSSLMKILSNRFPESKATKVEGEILYNGADRAEVSRRVPQFVSYVTQRDYHFPTLTVKETLEFAHECCGGELSKHAEEVFVQGTPEQNKKALEAAQAFVRHLPEVIIQQLGLEICQDTVVGNAMLRGVSGGERKRVTTGEMQFGNKSVIFMDEISTGLDSAAAYDIVKTQLSLARKLRKTVIISLLQPSPEIFELFDYVMILNAGHVIYHGPQEQSLQYFQDMGFICPPKRDVADFLLDIGTNQQKQYETGLPPGSKYPRKPRDLAELYEQSTIHEAILQDLHAPHDPELIRDREDYFDNIPEFHQNFWASTATVTRRQLMMTARDTPYLASRALMIILMGLINGTVFWQVDADQVQIVIGVLFQTILFLSFGQASQVPQFFTSRLIFYKQRGANFYRTASYVFAFSVCQLPLAIAETVVFGSLIYWMCGLVSSVSAFIIFELLILVTMMTLTAFFFLVSCVAPNLNVGQPMSMLVITFLVLFGGFIVSKPDIPDYFIWIYWINPISWGMRGLAINQYTASEFDVDVYNGINYMEKYGKKMGKYSLDLVGLQSDTIWLYFAFVYIIVVYLIFQLLSYLALEYFRYETPENIGLANQSDEDESYSTTTSPSSASDYALVQTPRGEGAAFTLDVQRSSRKSTPVTLAFKDLWYTVPNPHNPKEGLDLLKGISGYALPGSITALMGSSGAGKTTLMDVIAGRKTGGKIQGQILLNGYEATPLAIQRSTGYCEQMDIHCESATFREALTFSAFLRQSEDIPASEKYDSVEECLDLLDLRPIADKIIRGSSVEQMKRLTIGVELAAQPSVIFLDEPTSGLDARSAKMIMDSVRKVANTGRTVVCTIHQPSLEVFHVFDSLLLLKRGGYTVYFGDLGKNASELVNYLQAIDGVEPLEEGYNPATWMLEVIGAGVGNSAGQNTDFVEIFNNSEKKALLEHNLAQEGMTRPAPGASPLGFQKKRAASNSTQAKFVITRFFNMYWRTSSYNLTRIGICLFLSIVFALTFSSVTYSTYSGINSGLGMVFMTSLLVSMVSFQGVIPMIGDERASYYRERACQTYNAFWYFVGYFLVEIPYVFGSILIFVAILFPSVGFSGAHDFFIYWLVLSMFVLFMVYTGIFLSLAMPSVEIAVVIGVLFVSIFVLVMGFNPPKAALPHAYSWLYQLTPHRYVFEALSTTVFGNCGSDKSRVGCKVLTNAPPTVKEGSTVEAFLKDTYAMSYDNLWRDFGILAGAAALFAVLSLVAVRYVNHQKR